MIVGTHDKLQGKVTKSIDFDFDYLTFCVKKSNLMQPWKSAFLTATWQVWAIGACALYVLGFTLFVFYKYYHHQENFHYCVGAVFLLLAAIPIPYHPTHGLARIHFALLLFFGMLILIHLNCFLISMITNPQYQHQISTKEELLHYEYKILIDLKFVPLHDLGNEEVNQFCLPFQFNEQNNSYV